MQAVAAIRLSTVLRVARAFGPPVLGDAGVDREAAVGKARVNSLSSNVEHVRPAGGSRSPVPVE
jgi:hypothetical protein